MIDEALQGGAFIASSANALSKSQRRALHRILAAINSIARSESDRQNRAQHTYQRDIHRPRHAYLIDGARGAGKTTALLTLEAMVQQIGRSPAAADGEPPREIIRKLMGERGEEIFAPIKLGGARLSKPVCTLHVIFPADINSDESLIEAVIASVRKCIVNVAEDRERTSNVRVETIKSECNALLKKLDEKVAAAWRLSRPAGREAIQRDSLNVAHFLKISAAYEDQSQHRALLWRDFVNDLLGYVDAQILTVFFDDTDTEPRENFELLHTIRTFLDHPRIVSVVAGNLRSIRRALVVHHRSHARGSADPVEVRTDDELDRLVEEYLEKVLPAYNRHFIRRSEVKELGAQIGGGGPQNVSLFTHPFEDVCFSQLDRARINFLKAKLRVAHGPLTPDKTFEGVVTTERGVTRRGTPQPDLEEYTTWWLLRHFYANALAPRTMRQCVHLQNYINAREFGAGRVGSNKRIAVALFEMSENTRLIRSFLDTDASVLQWLHRQKLSSNWSGDRYFEIHNQLYYDGAFEFDFICFRVDLGIATPILNNPEEDVPSGLLPFPVLPTQDLSGQRLTRTSGRERRYGVSKWIDHPTVPLNCIYMFHLPALNHWLWRSARVSSGEAVLWAPSEVHCLWDFEQKWKDSVLDDIDAFVDVRTYWDLRRLGKDHDRLIERDELAKAWRDEATRGQLVQLRHDHARKEASDQRRAVADYVRACVVPLAAASQLLHERGRPSDQSDTPSFWRGEAFDGAIELLRSRFAKVEQSLAFMRRETNITEGAGAGARQLLLKAWSALADQLRVNFGASEEPMEGRFAPFAAILNDLIGAHMAVRVFESETAAVIKGEQSKPWSKADAAVRVRFIKHRKVVVRFLERQEGFSAAEPARVITLEDIQTLLSQMGRLGVLPPESHLDLAPMHAVILENRTLESMSESFQRGLEFFLIRVLLKKERRQALVAPVCRAGSPLHNAIGRDVIGYDVPIADDEVPESISRIAHDILNLEPEHILTSGGKIWSEMIELCGENLVGARPGEAVQDDKSKAAYWMCPEYFEFNYRARGARAFLLFLYALTPFMRSLYEVDREAFLNARAGRTLDEWRRSGRPFMWAEAAAKMRNFVRRFSDVLRLARMRLELYAFAYGDGGGDDLWRADPTLIEKIRALDGVKQKSQSNGFSDWFQETGGITFTHLPDFSHRSLGVNLGAEGRLDRDGILQATFDGVGRFFHEVYLDVPPNQWPILPAKVGGKGARTRKTNG